MPGAKVLPIMLYSDGSEETLGGWKFHPIKLILGALPLSEVHRRAAYDHIGMLPVLSAAKLGLGAKSKE